MQSICAVCRILIEPFSLTYRIQLRKMNIHPDVNFEELARSTDDFKGAQLKDVCMGAAMLALRLDVTELLIFPDL